MAEIHVERKPKKPIWPWILLLLIVLLVLGWWFFNDATNEQVPEGVEINSIEQNVPEKALAYDAVLLFDK